MRYYKRAAGRICIEEPYPCRKGLGAGKFDADIVPVVIPREKAIL